MSASDRSPDDLMEAAEAALADGQPQAALELCQRILAEDPQDPSAWLLEAEALRDLNEPSDAEHSYRRAIDLDADSAEAWNGLASTLFDQRRFREAATAWQRALRIAPDHADAWYGRALVREVRGDHAGARRAYLHAHHRAAGIPVPTSLSDAEVRGLLVQAAEPTDPEAAAWLSTCPLVVLDLPDAAVCEAFDPPAAPTEVLAHFAAPPEGSPMPPTLVAYRRNLERLAHARDAVQLALADGVVSEVSAWIRTAAWAEA